MITADGYNITIGFATEETARDAAKDIKDTFGFVVRIIQAKELI